ncbi:MAG: aminotransferase class V-fold PLP-dependent enzyme [Pirellulales bacterium]|nr:aminotransferase class V-fold PLP-dependent enzyme [Pirellulales bacterium]
MSMDIHNDDDWRLWREEWGIRPDTTYLNHGSFGPTPRRVRECQWQWQQKLASQPMDFFVRHLEPAWLAARERLARFVDTDAANLVFMENATAAMNVVAHSFPLGKNDEVLLTDHEYGAVMRIWQRACRNAGAGEPQVAKLPSRFESAEQVVEAIFAAANERTRLLVVSHITSPTAVILPVCAICHEARRRSIAVCIDGPHAPAQVPLAIDELGCDYYAASLHKWVSAPIGSGFLYVAPPRQHLLQPTSLSWGRLLPARPALWWEEFVWPGTRDPSAYLATSSAFDLLQEVGLEVFRARTHALASYAREQVVHLTGLQPPTPVGAAWYGSMASMPLPPGDAKGLQQALWQQYRIEVPVIEHNGQRSIRVSCHLYTNRADIDRLVEALGTLL